MKIIKLSDACTSLGLFDHMWKVISLLQSSMSQIVTHRSTTTTSQWNVFKVKEVIELITCLGFYSRNLIFKTHLDLIYNFWKLGSSCLLIGEDPEFRAGRCNHVQV